MLNLVAHPEVETYSRNKVATEELREFNILNKLFNAAGAAMFRVEVERNERRLRRLMLRLEEVQRTELRQRFALFRECHDVATKVVKEHAKLLRAAKLHSVEVVKRAAQRQACRESKHQIELFTRRNLTVVPEERVIRELSLADWQCRHRTKDTLELGTESWQTVGSRAEGVDWRLQCARY